MIQRCNICLDETCGGKRNCDCSKCKNYYKCPRFLHPTIRITTKCTQNCSHCLFSCSPDKKDFMSISTASNVGKFLENNDIEIITLMGGEFFCHPNWKKVFKEIIKDSIAYVRLVTNGDWAKNKSKDVLSFLSTYKDILKVSISRDKWHTNKYVKEAIKACEEQNLNFNVSDGKEDVLIPVGRGEMHYSFYGAMSCYCRSEQFKYSFLIDEKGEIYKCSAGVWPYASVQEYIEGGFDKEFKRYNMNFNKVFIPGCSSCYRSYQSSLLMTEKEKNDLMNKVG